jgi:hypothetical protein
MSERDEIWDEFRWEAFMKEQDKKADRYMELFYRHRDDPNRDEIIAREMGWFWLLGDSRRGEPDDTEAEEEEVEEGEEWKRALPAPDREKFLRPASAEPAACRRSREFAMRAMKFAEQLSDGLGQDSSVVDFVANAMIAGAKVAGGIGMGDEMDELGGNIAYCKRGLAAANLSLAALHEMKEKRIVGGAFYLDLLKNLTEVRNLIALLIVDLREKFRRGV